MVVMASSGAADVHDSSDFYDLWQAFVTVKAICVRNGRDGRISGMGRAGRLTMAVFSYG